jgi:dienelactone hydrolase
VRTRCALVVIAALAAGCGGDPHGSLTVRTASDLVDAPVTVTVHAQSGAVLHARWTAARGDVWTSAIPLRAGTVTVGGTRLLSRMRPAGPEFKHPYFLPRPVGPSNVALSVTEGSKTVARATLRRRLIPPSVRPSRVTVRRGGIDGFLYTPRVRARRPAVVVLGGSEGGWGPYDVAETLAAHGYPALSLGYFDVPGLPSQLVRIPLEYFARAVRFLRGRPGVDPRHVVVMGVSRGGEAALLVASTFPRLVHGAIGLVPSSTVFPAPSANLPAWTLHGKPVWEQPIRVERISGPVLTVGAGEDEVWGSASSVRQIERRLRAHRFRFAHEGIVYPHAGHGVGAALPYLPTAASDPRLRANAAARADLWPRILRYFARL